jgi:2-(1,2-epoxy-1,2-dihydrophenyl)acetyl-CoA isomerase
LEKEGPIAIVTLNRPESLNSFNRQQEFDCDAAIDEAVSDQSIRALILTGAGRGWSSGRDVRLLGPVAEGQPSYWDHPERAIRGGEGISMVTLASKLQQIPIPAIAAINGIAAGGGLGVALGCDIRIASERAQFMMAFIRRAVAPMCGSTYMLPLLIGKANASEMIFTGDIYDAQAALRMGLVSKVVPHEQLMDAAKELAGRMIRNAPLALAVTKRCIYQGMAGKNFDMQTGLEGAATSTMARTEDFKEATRSFLEKREPVYQGR